MEHRQPQRARPSPWKAEPTRPAWRSSSRQGHRHDQASRLAPVPVLQQGQHLIQLPHRCLQLADGVGGEFLGLGEIGGVFQRVLLQPLEAVQLEGTLLDLGDVERPPAVFLGVLRLPFGPAVGIAAVALLEVGEVRLGEWTVFLGNPGDVRPAVIDPDGLCRVALGEEDDVGLLPLAVRGERAARESEYGVEVTILGDDLEYLACLIGEEAVVR